jgi:hypothetical protein
LLPFSEKVVTTPTGHAYVGVDFARKLCGVSIIRSGEWPRLGAWGLHAVPSPGGYQVVLTLQMMCVLVIVRSGIIPDDAATLLIHTFLVVECHNIRTPAVSLRMMLSTSVHCGESRPLPGQPGDATLPVLLLPPLPPLVWCHVILHWRQLVEMMVLQQVLGCGEGPGCVQLKLVGIPERALCCFVTDQLSVSACRCMDDAGQCCCF